MDRSLWEKNKIIGKGKYVPNYLRTVRGNSSQTINQEGFLTNKHARDFKCCYLKIKHLMLNA